MLSKLLNRVFTAKRVWCSSGRVKSAKQRLPRKSRNRPMLSIWTSNYDPIATNSPTRNFFLQGYEDRLVILDEIHRVPEIFQTLRSIIDRGRQHWRRTNRFLILGSASIDLLKQSGETLAGRINTWS